MADESPRTPVDVDPTVTGTVTGATTWVPEAVPPVPLVPAAGVELLGAVAVAGWAGPVAVEPPSRPTEDEPRFMGAVTGATTCVPEAAPLEPVVLAAGAVPVVEAAAGAFVVEEESPTRANDVEPVLTGAVTGATTCVPERVPSFPLVVSAALAAVPPRAIKPPAKHVPIRHLRIVEFIVIFS
ncbi:hypothetical protein StoSoilA2_33800 [Arthrobacter sp. StoSoilA2]|uniref:hypothetical protein n=1 Tax=Arthrobacter sp. StoSoilA2 TaxID=2830990 RepID=UPI001CC3474D|nr:hypothetical protein [Arthrobacter sp. StoSoilA2]BCW37324.1 hypothetical protein StoSoilA2_33800 [Arthrobacter sp. StoSoilA2]